MAQGEFTKEEAARTLDTVNELFKAIPKSKQAGYLGHLNDTCLFIEAVRRNAPAEAVKQPKTRKGSK